MVFNTALNFVYNTHGHRITQWNNTILDLASLERYADTIFHKGAALDNCIGFIDGTVRPQAYGHKRVHALKFQSVALPNGMIANLY